MNDATPEAPELDAAWVRYADRIKAAGERITGDGFPTDGRLRAEGYRYVKRIEELARNIYIEFPSTTHPMLFRYGDDTTPFGATNVDNNYYRAMLDPAGEYRVTADVTGVQEVLFSVQDGEFVFGRTTVTAEAGLGDLDIVDGHLELHLGGPQRARNHLPLADDTVYLNIREFVTDWEHSALPAFHIERLDEVGPVPNLTPEAMTVALDRAATWVEASIDVWHTYADMLVQFTPVNDLAPPRPAEGGAQNMLHGATRWDLDPDQALVVTFEQPDVTYWSIQTYVIEWMQPLDFVNRTTSLNDGQLVADDDGKVRVVLAHADPGVPNWLDTSGLRSGLMSYRYVKPTTSPAPTTTLTNLTSVREHLPTTTPAITPAQRSRQIEARRRGAARRFRR